MKLIVVYFLLTLPLLLSAQANKPDTIRYSLTNGIYGMGGYDPVSYFSGKPVKGSTKFKAQFEHVTYLFQSKKNQETFLKSPESYLPQFGGWCSMTLAMGRATRPTFDNFLIDSGKLYLFERTLSVNGKELWLKNTEKNKLLASTNYKALTEKRP